MILQMKDTAYFLKIFDEKWMVQECSNAQI